MNQRKSNLFKSVPGPKVNRNLFDLSHEVKMSGKFGYLYPVLCVETLPGDTFRNTMNCMVRIAPMLAPVMHRLDVTTHFFFVPYRIITEHWEDFITGGQDGLDASVLPYITAQGIQAAAMNEEYFSKGSLWDYLGLPVWPGGLTPQPTVWSSEHISVLPFRACGKIWSDYYRDPNLDTEFDLDTEVGGNVSALSTTLAYMNINTYRRAFEKDYFTSALPWAQRGAQVLMPLSGTAAASDITYLPESSVFRFDGSQAGIGAVDIKNSAGQTVFEDAANINLRVENIDEVTFDNASTTINDFRTAMAIQRWLEANARGGARYVEQIQGHFNVTVPDYRLQRAEYLGGGKQPVQISEVLATATETGGDTVVGEMAGHGLSVGRTNSFSYRCQEHGLIIGFMSLTMRTAYSQGIPKMFLKEDKFEFAWPELANLGEQEIQSQELFYSYDDADEADNRELFGYTPRYSEYKFHNDRIAGDFRDTLGFWHLGRNFTQRPALDSLFTSIHEDGGGVEETFRRIFAVTNNSDYLWCQLYHRLTAKRPLPYFGVPKII